MRGARTVLRDATFVLLIKRVKKRTATLPLCKTAEMKMGLIGKIAGGLGLLTLVVGISLIGTSLFLGLAFGANSERTIFERVTSPDGWHEARVQFDDAGAVSSFDRIVFIKSRWNLSDAPLLSCRAFWADGEDNVQLHWPDGHTLVIEHAFPLQAIRGVAANCGAVQIVTKSLQASQPGREPISRLEKRLHDGAVLP